MLHGNLDREGKMARYRKKPVVIDAWQSFDDCGESTNVYPGWVMDAIALGVIFASANGRTMIKTLEGDLTVSDGDWIIKGVKNELYPCKPDVFTATYDPVSD
jgi:hypothetical protein